ncbi:glycosyltransferase family 2 protein [Salinimicrobium sp. WS361]|uniref:glycosyltransferase family 2 protein n=1 Tax=Salinimicrobium sp. WS361 TaxID=3425123 RepID=UPI003D6F5B9B
MEHKIAVVIPFYKIAFFEECLSSLASQSNKNFNVYIGNDASNEDPNRIIEKFERALNISYKRFEINLGQKSLTKQWERCLALIEKEEWFILLGDDDYLSDNYVQKFYANINLIKKYGLKVVRYASQEINEKGEVISKRFEHPVFQTFNDAFSMRFFEGSRSSLSEYIFSVEQYKKYGFRDLPLAWHADDLAWLEYSEFGDIFTINKATAFFRISTLNISRPNYLLEEKANTQYCFFEIIVKEYLNKFDRNTARKILKRFELLTYNLNKASFKFWKFNILYFLKYFGLFESVKFSRRVFLKGIKNE